MVSTLDLIVARCFVHDYHIRAATGFRADRYQDVSRGVEFIDTPGKLLSPGAGSPCCAQRHLCWPGIDGSILRELSYRAFSEDPVVQEIVGAAPPVHDSMPAMN